MEFFSKTVLLSILIVFSLICCSRQEEEQQEDKKKDSKKKVDCRVNIYAPVCRGIQNDSPGYKLSEIGDKFPFMNIEQWKGVNSVPYYQQPVKINFPTWGFGGYYY